jgi:hypothetical protein
VISQRALLITAVALIAGGVLLNGAAGIIAMTQRTAAVQMAPGEQPGREGPEERGPEAGPGQQGGRHHWPGPGRPPRP